MAKYTVVVRTKNAIARSSVVVAVAKTEREAQQLAGNLRFALIETKMGVGTGDNITTVEVHRVTVVDMTPKVEFRVAVADAASDEVLDGVPSPVVTALSQGGQPIRAFRADDGVWCYCADQASKDPDYRLIKVVERY